jgi:hypothetical protein
MTPNRPISTTFPLGLFCNATLSGPLPKPVEPKSALSQKNKLAPDTLPTDLEENGLNADLHWDDDSV